MATASFRLPRSTPFRNEEKCLKLDDFMVQSYVNYTDKQTKYAKCLWQGEERIIGFKNKFDGISN
jgi:hypothetical protein